MFSFPSVVANLCPECKGRLPFTQHALADSAGTVVFDGASAGNSLADWVLSDLSQHVVAGENYTIVVFQHPCHDGRVGHQSSFADVASRVATSYGTELMGAVFKCFDMSGHGDDPSVPEWMSVPLPQLLQIFSQNGKSRAHRLLKLRLPSSTASRSTVFTLLELAVADSVDLAFRQEKFAALYRERFHVPLDDALPGAHDDADAPIGLSDLPSDRMHPVDRFLEALLAGDPGQLTVVLPVCEKGAASAARTARLLRSVPHASGTGTWQKTPAVVPNGVATHGGTVADVLRAFVASHETTVQLEVDDAVNHITVTRSHGLGTQAGHVSEHAPLSLAHADALGTTVTDLTTNLSQMQADVLASLGGPGTGAATQLALLHRAVLRLTQQAELAALVRLLCQLRERRLLLPDMDGPLVEPPPPVPAVPPASEETLEQQVVHRDAEIRRLKLTILHLHEAHSRIKADMAAVIRGKYGDRTVIVQQQGQQRVWNAKVCGLDLDETNVARVKTALNHHPVEAPQGIHAEAQTQWTAAMPGFPLKGIPRRDPVTATVACQAGPVGGVGGHTSQACQACQTDDPARPAAPPPHPPSARDLLFRCADRAVQAVVSSSDQCTQALPAVAVKATHCTLPPPGRDFACQTWRPGVPVECQTAARFAGCADECFKVCDIVFDPGGNTPTKLVVLRRRLGQERPEQTVLALSARALESVRVAADRLEQELCRVQQLAREQEEWENDSVALWHRLSRAEEDAAILRLALSMVPAAAQPARSLPGAVPIVRHHSAYAESLERSPLRTFERRRRTVSQARTPPPLEDEAGEFPTRRLPGTPPPAHPHPHPLVHRTLARPSSSGLEL